MTKLLLGVLLLAALILLALRREHRRIEVDRARRSFAARLARECSPDCLDPEGLDPRCPECTGEVALSTGTCLDCGHETGVPELPGLHRSDQAEVDGGPLTISRFLAGRPELEPEPWQERWLADLILSDPTPRQGSVTYEESDAERLLTDASMPTDRVELRTIDGRVLRTILVSTTPSPADDRARLGQWLVSSRAAVDPDAAYFEWSPPEAFTRETYEHMRENDPVAQALWRAANPPVGRAGGAELTGLIIDEAMDLTPEDVRRILDAAPEGTDPLVVNFPRVELHDWTSNEVENRATPPEAEA